MIQTDIYSTFDLIYCYNSKWIFSNDCELASEVVLLCTNNRLNRPVMTLFY